MKFIQKIIFYVCSVVALGSMYAHEGFVKKKVSAPSVTECCDAGVDLLAVAADLVADIGILQQQLIAISRDVLDNNKKCGLASAKKESLIAYYDKTQACKDQLELVRAQVQSYTNHIKVLH